MKKRVLCLYRVSTLKQVDQNKDDIPMQKQACHECIAAHPDWVLYREISEKGVSGYKVSAEKRDAIQEIQQEALEKTLMFSWFSCLTDLVAVMMKHRLLLNGLSNKELRFGVSKRENNALRVMLTNSQTTFVTGKLLEKA